MGFKLGATSSHAALRHARIGGISWGRQRNVHQGERAALQHAVAVGAPLRFLVVDTMPLVYSLAARIAGQPLAAAAASAAPLDTVDASATGTRVPRDLSVLAETVVEGVVAQVNEYAELAHGAGARLLCCWDGPAVAELKVDTTSHRMRERAVLAANWARASQESELLRYASAAVMQHLQQDGMYSAAGVERMFVRGRDGHHLVAEDQLEEALLRLDGVLHIVAPDEADCLIARITRALRQPLGTAVLSVDGDMLAHDATLQGYRWLVCPVPATSRSRSRKRLLRNEPPPPYRSHFLYDRTLLGGAMSETWPQVFSSSSSFAPALYLALVALSTTDYANGLPGIGEARLTRAVRGTASEQGRLLPRAWSSIGSGPGAELRPTVHALIRRVAALAGSNAADASTVCAVADIYVLGTHGTATQPRPTTIDDHGSRNILGFRRDTSSSTGQSGFTFHRVDRHLSASAPFVPVLDAHGRGKRARARTLSRRQTRVARTYLVPKAASSPLVTPLTPPQRVTRRSGKKWAKKRVQKKKKGKQAKKAGRKPKLKLGKQRRPFASRDEAAEEEEEDEGGETSSSQARKTLIKIFGTASVSSSSTLPRELTATVALVAGVQQYLAATLDRLVEHLDPAYLTDCKDEELDRRFTELAYFCCCEAGGVRPSRSGMARSREPPEAGNCWTEEELLIWARHPDAPASVLRARRALQAGWPLVPRSLADHVMCQSVGQTAGRHRRASVPHLLAQAEQCLGSGDLVDLALNTPLGASSSYAGMPHQDQEMLRRRDFHMLKKMQAASSQTPSRTPRELLEELPGGAAVDLLEGWVRALQPAAAVGRSRPKAAGTFHQIFTPSSLPAVARAAPGRLAALGKWASQLSLTEHEWLERCGLFQDGNLWRPRPSLLSALEAMAATSRGAAEGTVTRLEALLSGSTTRSSRSPRASPWARLGFRPAWLPTGTLYSDGVNCRWLYVNLRRPKGRSDAETVQSMHQNVEVYARGSMWLAALPPAALQAALRAPLPLPSDEDFTPPRGRAGGLVRGMPDFKIKALLADADPDSTVVHVGIDPGNTNVAALHRTRPLLPGTIIEFPGTPPPELGLRPVVNAPRRYYANAAACERWDRWETLSIKPGALQRRTKAEPVHGAQESSERGALRPLTKAEPVRSAADAFARISHAFGVGAPHAEARKKDVKKKRGRAADEIIEWLACAPGFYSRRFQKWEEEKKLVVVAHVGDWPGGTSSGGGRGFKHPTHAGPLLRTVMQRAAFTPLPATILWRTQDEYLTSSVCPRCADAPPLLPLWRSRSARYPSRDVKYCPHCRCALARDMVGAANIAHAGVHQLNWGVGPWRPRA